MNGNHTFNFGGSITRVNFWQQLVTVVPTVNYGISSTLGGDSTAFGAFQPLAIIGQPGSNAASLYSTLAGRISSITRNARLSEDTNKYTLQGNLISRAHQTEYGVFAQDSWRVRPNLTLTLGLRWEVQGPFIPGNNTYARASSFAGLYGVSGEGNLFKPGTLTGPPTTMVLFEKGTAAYDTRYDSFAPSLGVTYSPNFDGGFMKSLFGQSGRTVLRGGFSIAFVREGTNTFQSLYAANAASGAQLAGGTISATQNITGTPFPLTFGNYIRSGIPGGPGFQQLPVYPNPGSITDSINEFLPNLKIGRVDSFSFGIQREINSNNVIEIRYIGNRGHNLWRQYDLNEVNVIENGFLMNSVLPSRTCWQPGKRSRLQLPLLRPGTGTSPLPIMLGHISGVRRKCRRLQSRNRYGFLRSALFQRAFCEYNVAWVPESANPSTGGGVQRCYRLLRFGRHLRWNR